LNQDGMVTGVGQVCAGIKITVPLNSSGNVVTSPAVYVWPNDVISPINSFYIVSGYTANGQLAWGPNHQQVLSSPSPFDLDAWIPDQLTNWTPPLQSPTLEHNGAINGSQSLLNLKNGTNVTITDDGLGGITINAPISATVLKTNGHTNTTQGLLNLKDGTDISITDDGLGGITFANIATPAPAALPRPDVARYVLWTDSTDAWDAVAEGDVITGQHASSSGADSGEATATSGPYFELGCTNGAIGYNYGKRQTFSGRAIKFLTRYTPITSLSGSERIWAALANVDAGNIATFAATNDPTTIKCIGFVADQSLNNNWHCKASDGSATTTFDTGISIALNTAAKLEMVYDPVTPKCDFYINGSLIHTITTNLPINQALAAVTTLTSGSGTNNRVLVDFVYAENASI
jgi:hypothetical protein